MQDKKEILEIILNNLDKDKRSLSESLIRCQREIQEAPGPTESHSDTTRYQSSQLAKGILEQIEAIESAITTIKNFVKRESTDIVSVGSLLEVEENNKKYFILIVPDGAGSLNLLEKNNLIVVSEKSPIGKNLIGKTIGNVFVIKTPSKEKMMKILKIC